MQFIDIKQTKNDTRQSSLVVDSGALRVIGKLPHGYCFEPLTHADADLLILYLAGWKDLNPRKKHKPKPEGNQ